MAAGVPRFEGVRQLAGVETTGRPTDRARPGRLSEEPGRSRAEASAAGEGSRAAWFQAAGAGRPSRPQPRSGTPERRSEPGSWSGSWGGRPAGREPRPASGRNGGRPSPVSPALTGSPGAATATRHAATKPASRRAAPTPVEAVGPASWSARRAPPAARPECPCNRRPEEPPRAPGRRTRGPIEFGGTLVDELGPAAGRPGAGHGVQPGWVRLGARIARWRGRGLSGRRRPAACPDGAALRAHAAACRLPEGEDGSDPSRQDVPGTRRFGG